MAPKSYLGSYAWGPHTLQQPQSHSRQDRGTLRPTEIIFGVVRVRTECSPTTPNHTLGRTEGHSDPPRSCLGSHAWGPAAAWEPRLWFRRGKEVPDGTEIIFGVARMGTRCCLGTPIMVSARRGDARWHRDHVWGYSALARAKPGTDGATGYAVLPLRFHRNARQGHTLFPASPAKATSRTPGLHTPEDSNFDLGLLQGSETHRSTCGPAQA